MGGVSLAPAIAAVRVVRAAGVGEVDAVARGEGLLAYSPCHAAAKTTTKMAAAMEGSPRLIVLSPRNLLRERFQNTGSRRISRSISLRRTYWHSLPRRHPQTLGAVLCRRSPDFCRPVKRGFIDRAALSFRPSSLSTPAI